MTMDMESLRERKWAKAAGERAYQEVIASPPLQQESVPALPVPGALGCMHAELEELHAQLRVLSNRLRPVCCYGPEKPETEGSPMDQSGSELYQTLQAARVKVSVCSTAVRRLLEALEV